jgi:hypothetical protein
MQKLKINIFAAKTVIHEVNEQIHHGPESGSTRKLKPYKASWLGQFAALMLRAWQALIQDSIIQWIKFYHYVVGFSHIINVKKQFNFTVVNALSFWVSSSASSTWTKITTRSALPTSTEFSSG